MPEDQLENELIEAFKIYDSFSRAMIDAFVLVEPSGKIVKCNQLFNILVGKKTKQILKAESLDELMTFQIEGNITPVRNLSEYRQTVRLDEVRGNTELEKNLNLILGLYPFEKDGKSLGFFLLIRDVTAETNLQGKYKVKSTQSITDKLTGLFNRTYFEQYLPGVLEQMAGEGGGFSISVAMSDIDHFKKINDTYGHQAGDYVLELVAKSIKESCRKTDIICRYGGEEFLIIFPGTDLDEAYAAAEKARIAVGSRTYHFNGKDIPVTISFGISQIKVGAETGVDAIARADLALYHSKETGRNRVSRNKDGTIS